MNEIPGPFEELEIIKDGMTFCIDATSHDRVRIEALLREDADGWYLSDTVGGNWYIRIGRRKDWTLALADALRLMYQRCQSAP